MNRNRLTALLAAAALAVLPACGDDDGKGVGERIEKEAGEAKDAIEREGKESGQDLGREGRRAKKKLERGARKFERGARGLERGSRSPDGDPGMDDTTR